MKAIVFGGSGFLGSHVTDALTEAGHQAVVYDVVPSPYLRPGQEMVIGDVLDEEKVKRAIRGCEVAYNFAGVADIDEAANRPLDTIKYNILGNCNILEAARIEGIRRYVFASTVYVYSRSGSFYRCSKLACENYIEEYQRQHGLDYTILRYGTLYGPRADRRNSIYRYIHQALSEGKITYPGTGQETREYINVLDAAKGSVEILNEQYVNSNLILTGHSPMKVADLFATIDEILGSTLRIEYRCETPAQCPNHYNNTPYNFTPRLGKKYVQQCFTDMGQGLLQTIEEIFGDIHHSCQKIGS